MSAAVVTDTKASRTHVHSVLQTQYTKVTRCRQYHTQVRMLQKYTSSFDYHCLRHLSYEKSVDITNVQHFCKEKDLFRKSVKPTYKARVKSPCLSTMP
jgi:hypothetical protein